MSWILGVTDLSIPLLRAVHAAWNSGATSGVNGMSPALGVASGAAAAGASLAAAVSSPSLGGGGFGGGDGGSAAPDDGGAPDARQAPDPAWHNNPDSMESTTSRVGRIKPPPGGFQPNPAYQGVDGVTPGSTVSNVDGYSPTQTNPYADGVRMPDGPLKPIASGGGGAGSGGGDGSGGGNVSTGYSDGGGEVDGGGGGGSDMDPTSGAMPDAGTNTPTAMPTGDVTGAGGTDSSPWTTVQHPAPAPMPATDAPDGGAVSAAGTDAGTSDVPNGGHVLTGPAAGDYGGEDGTGMPAAGDHSPMVPDQEPSGPTDGHGISITREAGPIGDGNTDRDGIPDTREADPAGAPPEPMQPDPDLPTHPTDGVPPPDAPGTVKAWRTTGENGGTITATNTTDGAPAPDAPGTVKAWRTTGENGGTITATNTTGGASAEPTGPAAADHGGEDGAGIPPAGHDAVSTTTGGGSGGGSGSDAPGPAGSDANDHAPMQPDPEPNAHGDADTGNDSPDDHTMHPDNDKTGSGLQPTTEVRQDGSSIETIPNQNGTTTTVEHGTTDDVTKTTQYDNDGHVTGSRIEYTDPDDGTKWDINRDANGNMVSEHLTASDGSTKTVDPVDANGDRLRTDRDGGGQVTGTDVFHRDGTSTATKYDTNGDVTVIGKDADGTVTGYVQTHADGSTETVTVHDTNGDQSRIARDPNGDLSRSVVEHQDGTITRTSNTNNIDGTVSQTTSNYDANDNLISTHTDTLPATNHATGPAAVESGDTDLTPHTEVEQNGSSTHTVPHADGGSAVTQTRIDGSSKTSTYSPDDPDQPIKTVEHGPGDNTVTTVSDGKGHAIQTTTDDNNNVLRTDTINIGTDASGKAIVTGGGTYTDNITTIEGKTTTYSTTTDAHGTITDASATPDPTPATNHATGPAAVDPGDTDLTPHTEVEQNGSSTHTVPHADGGSDVTQTRIDGSSKTSTYSPDDPDQPIKTVEHGPGDNTVTTVSDGKGHAIQTTTDDNNNVLRTDTVNIGTDASGKAIVTGGGTYTDNITTIDGKTTTYSTTTDAHGAITDASATPDPTPATNHATGPAADANGTGRTPPHPELAQGSVEGTTTIPHADGPHTLTARDGSSARAATTYGADGQPTMIGLNGSGPAMAHAQVTSDVVPHQDGTSTSRIPNPDGTSTEIFRGSTGATGTSTYDPSGRLMAYHVDYPNGVRMVGTQDADSNYVQTWHDAQGHVTQVDVTPPGAPVGGPGSFTDHLNPDGSRAHILRDTNGDTATTTYDPSGKPTNYVVSHADGSSMTQPPPDANGNLTKTWADAHGRVNQVDVIRSGGIRVTSTSYEPDGASTTSYFDQSGNLSNHVVTRTDGSTISQPLPEPGGDRYRIYADADGTITHVDAFHPDGRTTQTDYVTTTDGTTTETTTTTDAHGDVLSATSRDSRPAAAPDQVVRGDSLGTASPITVAQPDGNVVTFNPDRSQLVQFPNGEWVHYAPNGAELGRGYQRVASDMTN